MFKWFTRLRHLLGLCYEPDWAWDPPVYCEECLEAKRFERWDAIGLGYVGGKR